MTTQLFTDIINKKLLLNIRGELTATMKAKFICHPDFENQKPINVFFKELEDRAKEEIPPFLNRHILFRKKISLNKFKRAVINITADDYFKLYINGKYVVQGPPNGYPSRYYYMEVDVTEYLVEGENVISAHTYYQGLINHVFITADRRSMFWCELFLDDKLTLVSDESWKCANHTGFSECGRFGYDTAIAERYDSSAKEVGFEKIDFDDGCWENAKVLKYADYNLFKSPIKPLDVYEVLPVKIDSNENSIIVDFGQEMVGYLYAEAQGNYGNKIIMRFAEELNDDGSIRYDMRCNCLYEEEWLLSGNLDILNQYDFKAFRYAELVLPQGVKVNNVKMVIRHYPFAQTFKYETDNNDLKKIIELCTNTIKFGVQEAYYDCPTREKGQYLGDLAVSGRAHAILTGDTTLLKKSLTDFCQSTFVCKGMLAVTYSTLNQEIADYSLLFPAIALWVYKQDNDKEFLEFTLPYVEGIFDYFKSYSVEDGLIGSIKEKWNLVDWPNNLRDGYDFPLTRPIGDGEHNVLNAFWIGFLKAREEICKILGKEIETLSEKITKAYINAFFDEKTKLFCDSREKTHSAIHSNILPLAFGIGTDDEKIKENIKDFLLSKKLTSMGVYMSYFALVGLIKNGYNEEALCLATDKGAWLNMIKEGATTTFEAWGKDQKWNSSLFHPWAVAPLIVFNGKTDIY